MTGESRAIYGETVYGVGVDGRTRCCHYHGPLDVIALRFRCCERWYPCSECHAACADHPAQVWPVDERAARAVLCGVCGHQLTIDEYLGCDSECPICRAGFNPGCALHHDRYFAGPREPLSRDR